MVNLRYCAFILLSFFLQSVLVGQDKGIIFGKIFDQALDEPLPFATAGIPSINLGASTDIDGRYRLVGIPPGTHTIEFSYLGYETQEREITIRAGEELQYDIELSEGGLTIDEIVVTGQAVGQRAAINRQINSNTIVNVISKQKLQELPDQNAAESVGRLAGVSVYRDAGEGQQVSIRGISPRFNAITVNGERLPSTEQETRSVDLSMISADALEGIELFKAIRPDMDADAIGGTVNFTIKRADEDWKGNLRILGGYNDLKSDFGQFRASGSISNRFFNNKLGVIFSANYQQINRSNEFINSDYEFVGSDPNTDEPIIKVATFNLGDRLEDRVRFGGVLTLDYEFNNNHNIMLTSNLSRLERSDEQYRRRYRVANNEQRFTARTRERNTELLTSTLSGEHIFGSFTMDWRGSFSSSDQQSPFSLRGQFWELAAMDGSINDNDLSSVPLAFKNRVENTTLRDLRLTSDFVDEKRSTFQMNLNHEFVASDQLNGSIKVGGKYRSVSRARDKNEVFMRPYLDGPENPARLNPGIFVTRAGNQILMANFLGDYRNDEFFDGQYDILAGTEEIRNSVFTSLEGLNLDEFNRIFDTNYEAEDLLDYQGHVDLDKLVRFYDEYKNLAGINGEADLEDYDGKEDIYAGYAMVELNFKKWLMVMGGLRYERTDQEYTSRTGSPREEDDGGSGLIEITNVSAAQGYDELMPMAHLRIKPSEWFDIRAAVTKTLARPNFFNLVPWERINNSEQSIQRGKPDLKHTTAWNYDLFLSFYNKFGLFTVGGFYKELDNIDYVKTTAIVETGNVYNGYSLTEPANVRGTSTVRGVEFDLQVNFRSLDGFWKGIVLGTNLTIAKSKTFYPIFEVNTEFIPTSPFFVTTLLDTTRVGPIVGQADLITNLIFGYETGGFSGRISAVHQTKNLSPGNTGVGRAGSGVGRIPELDFFDDKFWRVDIALKQQLDKEGKFTLLANLNNLTNTPERALLGTNNFLTEEEFFGFTADFGILYKFRK